MVATGSNAKAESQCKGSVYHTLSSIYENSTHVAISNSNYLIAQKAILLSEVLNTHSVALADCCSHSPLCPRKWFYIAK